MQSREYPMHRSLTVQEDSRAVNQEVVKLVSYCIRVDS